jgi:hypothetical protein
MINQQEALVESSVMAAGIYLELVQSVTEGVPQCIVEIVRRQLMQLNSIHISDVGDGVALELQGDQYRAYTVIINSIQASRHTGVHFFVTGPGGTGKSFLLKALEAWCIRSRQKPLLLAPTGIAANNVTGRTIHSTLSLFNQGGSYRSSIFGYDPERADELRAVKVLILDEVSMVDSQLFGFVSAIFSRLHKNLRPFGNIHVIIFGDLMQLPPVSGMKVFNSPIWHLFHPLFLKEPQRQIEDRTFFDLLNKIRFGIIDDEVKMALMKRAQAFDLQSQTYMTTFLCSLRADAVAMNNLILSTLPAPDGVESIFSAQDCENGEPVKVGWKSRIFKHGTNFPATVTCVVGAKVMFLTNSMIQHGISNGTCGVIVELRANGGPNVAFPTKEGIRVSLTLYSLTAASNINRRLKLA